MAYKQSVSSLAGQLNYSTFLPGRRAYINTLTELASNHEYALWIGTFGLDCGMTADGSNVLDLPQAHPDSPYRDLYRLMDALNDNNNVRLASTGHRSKVIAGISKGMAQKMGGQGKSGSSRLQMMMAHTQRWGHVDLYVHTAFHFKGCVVWSRRITTDSRRGLMVPVAVVVGSTNLTPSSWYDGSILSTTPAVVNKVAKMVTKAVADAQVLCKSFVKDMHDWYNGGNKPCAADMPGLQSTTPHRSVDDPFSNDDDTL